MEDGTTLRVAEDHPRDLGVGELLSGDLAGIGAVAFVVEVLSGDGDFGADEGGGEEEVEGGGGDDDLNGRVELGVVQVLNDGLDVIDGAIGLEVASDEEFAGHCDCICGWIKLRSKSVVS